MLHVIDLTQVYNIATSHILADKTSQSGAVTIKIFATIANNFSPVKILTLGGMANLCLHLCR